MTSRGAVVLMVAVAIAEMSNARAGEVAVSVPEVAPSVRFVVSGGYWKKGVGDGTYRVVVACAGWEHVGCSVRVDWIVSDPEKEAQVVISSALVEGVPDGWSMLLPELKSDPGTGSAVMAISAVDPHSLKNAKFDFLLGPPGDVRRAPPKR